VDCAQDVKEEQAQLHEEMEHRPITIAQAIAMAAAIRAVFDQQKFARF
jgi:hypothetical protein